MHPSLADCTACGCLYRDAPPPRHQEHSYGPGYEALREVKLLKLRQFLQHCNFDHPVLLTEPPNIYAMPAVQKGLICTQLYLTDPVPPPRPPPKRGGRAKAPPPPPVEPPCVTMFWLLATDGDGGEKAADVKKATPGRKYAALCPGGGGGCCVGYVPCRGPTPPPVRIERGG